MHLRKHHAKSNGKEAMFIRSEADTLLMTPEDGVGFKQGCGPTTAHARKRKPRYSRVPLVSDTLLLQMSQQHERFAVVLLGTTSSDPGDNSWSTTAITLPLGSAGNQTKWCVFKSKRSLLQKPLLLSVLCCCGASISIK